MKSNHRYNRPQSGTDNSTSAAAAGQTAAAKPAQTGPAAARLLSSSSFECRCPCCTPDPTGRDAALWAFEVEDRPDLTRLKRYLLSQGGTRFENNAHLAEGLPPDLTSKLHAKGQIFDGKEAQRMPMVPGHCHANVLLLALREGVEWWTGLALLDGRWQLHSWGRMGSTIIETTDAREQYFGIKLPPSYLAEMVVHRHEFFVALVKKLVQERRAYKTKAGKTKQVQSRKDDSGKEGGCHD